MGCKANTRQSYGTPKRGEWEILPGNATGMGGDTSSRGVRNGQRTGPTGGGASHSPGQDPAPRHRLGEVPRRVDEDEAEAEGLEAAVRREPAVAAGADQQQHFALQGPRHCHRLRHRLGLGWGLGGRWRRARAAVMGLPAGKGWRPTPHSGPRADLQRTTYDPPAKKNETQWGRFWPQKIQTTDFLQ